MRLCTILHSSDLYTLAYDFEVSAPGMSHPAHRVASLSTLSFCGDALKASSIDPALLIFYTRLALSLQFEVQRMVLGSDIPGRQFVQDVFESGEECGKRASPRQSPDLDLRFRFGYCGWELF